MNKFLLLALTLHALLIGGCTSIQEVCLKGGTYFMYLPNNHSIQVARHTFGHAPVDTSFFLSKEKKREMLSLLSDAKVLKINRKTWESWVAGYDSSLRALGQHKERLDSLRFPDRGTTLADESPWVIDPDSASESWENSFPVDDLEFDIFNYQDSADNRWSETYYSLLTTYLVVHKGVFNRSDTLMFTVSSPAMLMFEQDKIYLVRNNTWRKIGGREAITNE